jgi:hypothetical protein
VGVFVDINMTDKISPYTITLIGTDGKVAAQIQPQTPRVYTAYVQLTPAPPLVSVTSDRVYYADGDTGINYLNRDGTTGFVMHYPGSPTAAAGFAVSPDDKRIAIATLAYHNPTDMNPAVDLYVEDIDGSHRVELFSSNNVAEWPVGWSNGKLVIAVGPPLVSSATTNPYNAAVGYHVADPATGKRLVTMRDSCVYGPLEPSGSACWTVERMGAQGFDGAYHEFVVGPGDRPYLALSPVGNLIASRPRQSGASLVVDGSVYGTFQPDGIHPISAIPMGWIDDTHLVYFDAAFGRSILTLNPQNPSSVVVTAIPACAECSGRGAGAFFGAITSTP